MADLCLVGGGEHARVVAEAAALNQCRVLGAWAPQVHPVLHHLGDEEDLLANLDRWRSVPFHLAFVGKAGSEGRRSAAERWTQLTWQTITHHRAYVSPSARIEDGVFIGPGAVIHAGASVGPHAIVNSGAIVEHDVRVGPGVHIAPGAVIGGGSELGAWCSVGLGARVRDHCVIGPGSVVGMGAVVVKNVGPSVTVLGVPARER